MADKKISFSTSDKVRLDTHLASIENHFDKMMPILLRALKAGNKKPKRVRFTIEQTETAKARFKACTDFPDGTCGCVVIPPGISRVCGPGDFD